MCVGSVHVCLCVSLTIHLCTWSTCLCVYVYLCIEYVCVWYVMFHFSGYDSSFMSNIQKLFTERIEVFSSVDFSKISIVTGVIKITLKVTGS